MGRRLGCEAGRVGICETLSRISESGESRASTATLKGGAGEVVTVGEAASTTSSSGKLVDETKRVCRSVAESKVGVVVVVFLLTFVLLCAVNPPMAQDRETPQSELQRSWKKITAWSSLAAVLALALPFVGKLVKSDK